MLYSWVLAGLVSLVAAAPAAPIVTPSTAPTGSEIRLSSPAASSVIDKSATASPVSSALVTGSQELRSTITGLPRPVITDRHGPCASVDAVTAAQTPAKGDFATVPAQLAYECMNSVPFHQDAASELLDKLQPYLEWQTNLDWVKDPPAEYAEKVQKGYDFRGVFDQIKQNVSLNAYKNEYEFEFSLYRAVQQVHDGHFVYVPTMLRMFQFGRLVPLVSVADDAHSVPEIYVFTDIVMTELLSSSFEPSPVIKINGQDVNDFLTDIADLGSSQDKDALWNGLFWNAAQVAMGGGGTGLGVWSGGARGVVLYPGAWTNLTFANGSTSSTENYAQVVSPNFDDITSGPVFYEKNIEPYWSGEPAPYKSQKPTATDNGQGQASVPSPDQTPANILTPSTIPNFTSRPSAPIAPSTETLAPSGILESAPVASATPEIGVHTSELVASALTLSNANPGLANGAQGQSIAVSSHAASEPHTTPVSTSTNLPTTISSEISKVTSEPILSTSNTPWSWIPSSGSTRAPLPSFSLDPWTKPHIPSFLPTLPAPKAQWTPTTTWWFPSSSPAPSTPVLSSTSIMGVGVFSFSSSAVAFASISSSIMSFPASSPPAPDTWSPSSFQSPVASAVSLPSSAPGAWVPSSISSAAVASQSSWIPVSSIPGVPVIASSPVPVPSSALLSQSALVVGVPPAASSQSGQGALLPPVSATRFPTPGAWASSAVLAGSPMLASNTVAGAASAVAGQWTPPVSIPVSISVPLPSKVLRRGLDADNDNDSDNVSTADATNVARASAKAKETSRPAASKISKSQHSSNSTTIDAGSDDSSDKNSAPASTGSRPAYPKAVVQNPANNGNSGFFLDGTDYGDVAVLAVSDFAGHGGQSGQYFQDTNRRVIEQAVRAGKKKLIIDLSANGGGDILQAYDLFKQLFPDQSPEFLARWRAHSALSLLGQQTSNLYYTDHQAWNRLSSDNSSIKRDEEAVWDFKKGTDQDDKDFTSWDQKYGPYPSGPGKDQFTSLIKLNLSDPLEWEQAGNVTVTGYGPTNVTQSKLQPFASENIVMVYDGFCASTCTVFSEMMRRQGKVKTVAMGGRPNRDMIQAVGGTKGAQVFELSSIFSSITNMQGIVKTSLIPIWSDTILGNYSDFPLLQGSAAASLNVADAIKKGDKQQVPLQFQYEPADCRMYYTRKMIVDQSVIWKSVADAAWLGRDGCVAGSLSGVDGNATTITTRSAKFRRQTATHSISSDIDAKVINNAMGLRTGSIRPRGPGYIVP